MTVYFQNAVLRYSNEWNGHQETMKRDAWHTCLPISKFESNIFANFFIYVGLYWVFFYKINGQLHIYFTWVYITFSKNIQERYFFSVS